MRRLAVCLLLAFAALGSTPGASKPRHGGPLSKRQCAEICVQVMKCLGLPLDQSSTIAETLICADDCVIESKDKQRRPGWLCASKAEGCEALKKCNPGGKGEAEK